MRPRLEPKVRAMMWPGSETGSGQGLSRDLSQVSGKRLDWDPSLGRGRDCFGWSIQGLGWGLNLAEGRDQAGAGALVRA